MAVRNAALIVDVAIISSPLELKASKSNAYMYSGKTVSYRRDESVDNQSVQQYYYREGNDCKKSV